MLLLNNSALNFLKWHFNIKSKNKNKNKRVFILQMTIFTLKGLIYFILFYLHSLSLMHLLENSITSVCDATVTRPISVVR